MVRYDKQIHEINVHLLEQEAKLQKAKEEQQAADADFREKDQKIRSEAERADPLKV